MRLPVLPRPKIRRRPKAAVLSVVSRSTKLHCGSTASNGLFLQGLCVLLLFVLASPWYFLREGKNALARCRGLHPGVICIRGIAASCVVAAYYPEHGIAFFGVLVSASATHWKIANESKGELLQPFVRRAHPPQCKVVVICHRLISVSFFRTTRPRFRLHLASSHSPGGSRS